MRKDQIAEWIFKLFTTPERAASTVGDMVEEAPGALWFWISVVRTVFSFTWRDMSADPLYMAGLAIRAWLLSAALFFGFILALAVLFGVVVGMLASAGILNEKSFSPPSVWISGIEWPLIAFFSIAIPFRIGRWIARRAPGREVAACIALQIVPFLIMNIVGSVVMHIWGPAIIAWVATRPAQNTPDLLPGLSWLPGALSFIAVMAGAIQMRRRAAQTPVA
jgi:hypothetical protein